MNSINKNISSLYIYFSCSLSALYGTAFAQTINSTSTSAVNEGNQKLNDQTSPSNIQNKLNSSAINSTFPKLMILPWHTPNVDADALQKTKTARAQVFDQLQKTFAPSAVRLDGIAPKNPKMESARAILKSVYADINSENPTPLAVFPLWTRIHDYDFFALVVIDPLSNVIRKIHHRVIPRSQWHQVQLNQKFEEFFGPGFTELANTVKLQNLPVTNQDLAVIFRDQTASMRTNEIDRAVLSAMLLLGNGQISNQKILVLNTFNTELITTIQKFYSDKTSMRKANREIVTRISYDKPPVDIKLPLVLSLNIRATDGVFGQSLPWTWTETLTLSAKSDKTLDLKFSDRLTTELTQEQESLRRDELPQISKIVGAWAYIDKGRAWGLQMNDRLISNDNPTKIKGHIVSYFGPELKLKSPRGWPINEGAIVFIRKGQKEIRLGQTLTYDGMKAPTPWPPETQNTSTK